MKTIKRFILDILTLLILIISAPYVALMKKNKNIIVFGTIPMIQYKYWADALNKIGVSSQTIVSKVYNIHNENIFDIISEKLIPRFLSFNKKLNFTVLGPFFTFFYILRNASVFNSSFMFGAFNNSLLLSKIEFFLYKIFGIKIIITGFGGDFYMYSKILDKSLTHALLLSYPKMAQNETSISKSVNFLIENADFLMMGFQLDGIGRWDCLMPSYITIDNNLIFTKNKHENEKVIIVHTPNHKGFKGSEFIINAVGELKTEGYNIDLKLLEGIKNEEVLKILKEEADILVEQLIFPGYGLSAIEGMASGIPVLSNLENKTYMELFRRYSFLDECPILSTSPETIKTNLKLLIENKKLRVELGDLGIQYVKKYHSEEMAQFLYTNVFDKLLKNKEIDLLSLYHPLKSEYVKQNFIKTPLVKNQYLG